MGGRENILGLHGKWTDPNPRMVPAFKQDDYYPIYDMHETYPSVALFACSLELLISHGTTFLSDESGSAWESKQFLSTASATISRDLFPGLSSECFSRQQPSYAKQAQTLVEVKELSKGSRSVAADLQRHVPLVLSLCRCSSISQGQGQVLPPHDAVHAWPLGRAGLTPQICFYCPPQHQQHAPAAAEPNHYFVLVKSARSDT
jgi:hypothetical protein